MSKLTNTANKEEENTIMNTTQLKEAGVASVISNPLEDMFQRQAAFQRRTDATVFSGDLRVRVAAIKEHSIHTNQEINEMLYELPYFKHWKDYSGMTDEEKEKAMVKAREELIDAWHFFMNMAIALGFTADAFYEEYLRKNGINHKRQDEGYTHDKCFR